MTIVLAQTTQPIPQRHILAKENDIHLITLPSHLIHILQPLDIAFFKPLKAEWSKMAEDFTWRETKPVTKVDFPSLFTTVWNNASKLKHTLSGFRCTSIHPYNPDAILLQVYVPNERLIGCVKNANASKDNSVEGKNEDEMSIYENNENEDNDQDDNDNDGINTKPNNKSECGNRDEDKIVSTNTDHDRLLLRHYKRVE